MNEAPPLGRDIAAPAHPSAVRLALPHLFGYLWKYKREFAAVSSLGVAIGVVSPVVVSALKLAEKWPSLNAPLVLIFVLTTGIAFTLQSFPWAVAFWRRYRATQALQQPPLQGLDLVALGFALFLGVLAFTLWPEAVTFWHGRTWSERWLLLAIVGVPSTWAVASCLGSLRQVSHAREAKESSPSQASGDLIDDPINDDSQDALGRIPFVETLYQQVVRVPSPKAFAFGLNGTWGEGKTSVLNLLEQRLRQHQEVLTVTFNPWYLEKGAGIVSAFYDAIDRAIQKDYLVGELSRLLRKYGALLSAGLKSVGLGFEIRLHDDPEQLRKEVEKWITRLGRRMVILIDDIDRLRPEETLAVFKCVGLSAKLRGVVFVLSFDEVVVRSQLRDILRTDPEFIEKIVQKPMTLPPADQADIDWFLLYSDAPGSGTRRSAIDKLFDELNVDAAARRAFDEKMVYFYRSHLRVLFTTLRRAKRYVNGLRANVPPIHRDVCLFDACLLEVLRVFAPEVSRDMWANPWFYVPASWSGELMVAAPFRFMTKDEDRYKAIRLHLEEVLTRVEYPGTVRAILEEMFSIEVQNAFRDGGWVDVGGSGGEYRAQKRITHPECFPTYFFLRNPRETIPDHVVEGLIGEWNGARAEEVEAKAAGTLREFLGRNQGGQLLAKMRVFRGQLHAGTTPGVVRALCGAAPTYDHTERFLASDYDRAEALVLGIIEDRAAEGNVRALVEEVADKSEPLHFAVLLALSCHKAGRGSRIAEHVDLRRLRRIVAGRLEKYYVAGHRDIVAELSPEEWGFVVFQWGTDWMTNEKESQAVVQGYMLSLVDQTPAYLGRILEGFLDRVRWPEGAVIRFDELSRLYVPAEIKEQLDRYGDTALEGDRARAAAEAFRAAYPGAERGQGGSQPTVE